MKRKAYEEAGLSVAQQPSSRLTPAAESKLGPSNTPVSKVILAPPETMHLKTEKSAGQIIHAIFFFHIQKNCLLLLIVICHHWRHQLWGSGAGAPSSSSTLIFSVTLELHKVWHWLCAVALQTHLYSATAAELVHVILVVPPYSTCSLLFYFVSFCVEHSSYLFNYHL